MKALKTIFITILFVLSATLIGCNGGKDLPEKHISQIRSDVFYGEKDDLCIFVYSERRELPFIGDGYVGKMYSCLIVRVPYENQSMACTLSYGGKTYSASLSFDPTTACSTATIEVEKLPKDSLTALLNDNEMTLYSKLNKDSISPNAALKRVLKQEGDFVSSLYFNGKFNAEIYVRLLTEGEFNYYYVGFAQTNKITAFLLDAKTGEIIAGRTSA